MREIHLSQLLIVDDLILADHIDKMLLVRIICFDSRTIEILHQVRVIRHTGFHSKRGHDLEES